jgi:hypothetical protein
LLLLIKGNPYEKSYFDLTIIRKVGFGVKEKGSPIEGQANLKEGNFTDHNTPQKLDKRIRCMLASRNREGGRVWFQTGAEAMMPR